MIRARRLQLYSRLLHVAPPDLLSMLSAIIVYKSKSFAAQVLADLREMRTMLPYLDFLGDPSENPNAWYTYEKTFPEQFKSAIDKFASFHSKKIY